MLSRSLSTLLISLLRKDSSFRAVQRFLQRPRLSGQQKFPDLSKSQLLVSSLFILIMFDSCPAVFLGSFSPRRPGAVSKDPHALLSLFTMSEIRIESTGASNKILWLLTTQYE